MVHYVTCDYKKKWYLCKNSQDRKKHVAPRSRGRIKMWNKGGSQDAALVLNFPWIKSYNHSHFLTTTFDFTSLFTLAFWGHTLFHTLAFCIFWWFYTCIFHEDIMCWLHNANCTPKCSSSSNLSFIGIVFMVIILAISIGIGGYCLVLA